MIKFLDANYLIEASQHEDINTFVDKLDPNVYATSVLVLAEVFHKLQKKNMSHCFMYLRTIMSVVTVFDITQNDFFEAMKNPLQININDKIHLAVMKRNNIKTIISYDKDFDKDKTISREEPYW